MTDEEEDYDIDVTFGDKRIRLNLSIKEWLIIAAVILLSGYACDLAGII